MSETDTVKDIRSAIVFRSASKNSSDVGVDIPTKRSFTLNSYKWVDKYSVGGHINLLDNNTVPKLKMIERQPIKKQDWTKSLEKISSIQQLSVVKALLDSSLVVPDIASQYLGSKYLNHLSDEYSSNTDKAKSLLDISDISELIQGPIINTYEIPFFNSAYLMSNTKDGWETGSAIDSLGSLGTMINDGFKANIIKSPQWSQQSQDGMNWETEFYLLNDTLSDLANNFTFINAIFPATQWVRMKHQDMSAPQFDNSLAQTTSNEITTGVNFAGNQLNKFGALSFIKSPNIFEVECPGRFRQLFVALDIEVTFEGNVRKMPLHNIMKGISQVDETTLYPDAYKIRFSAKDMTPPCYNVYANYLMCGKQVIVKDT